MIKSLIRIIPSGISDFASVLIAEITPDYVVEFLNSLAVRLMISELCLIRSLLKRGAHCGLFNWFPKWLLRIFRDLDLRS